MKKEQVQDIINNLLSTGADFAEAYYENIKTKSYSYIDNKLDGFNIDTKKGLGLRIALKDKIYYGATNDFSSASLSEVINSLIGNINSKSILPNVKLEDLTMYQDDIEIPTDDNFVKDKLQMINKLVRSKDDRINQVSINFINKVKVVNIANHKGKYVGENRTYSRIYITIYFKDKDNVANITYSKGRRMGLELLNTIDYEKEIDNLIKEGLDKLYAKPCVGKVMPVIIGNGFGGVIFHEACGHAMEATSVADGLSVLSHDLNNKIATDKVTIIDDGTIDKEWGSSRIDDEGNFTKKNTLIKNGILANYLIDELNNRKMKMEITGSGRRESYIYAPTSRMNNTYLAPGCDKIEDMIKSIDFGLYAKKLGGGCVSPETGDFNFNCDLAYMIRNGKVCECVKSASLIGNTKEILQSVEMVSDDLELGCGMCGSVSGYVPVNVGQPTIKVSHILVGGTNEE